MTDAALDIFELAEGLADLGFGRVKVVIAIAAFQEGDPLFQMDRKPFEAQLSAAKAELAQQQARLTNARANLKRVKPLAAQNAVAQKELDDALGVFRSAAASVEAAKAKVVQSELDLGYTEIRSPVTGLASFAVKREGSYIGFTDSLLTYVAQIDDARIEETHAGVRHLEITADVLRRYGGLWFNDEVFVLGRRKT